MFSACAAGLAYKKNRQTDRQKVVFAIKITNMVIYNEKMKRQEISIKIEPIADMKTTL